MRRHVLSLSALALLLTAGPALAQEEVPPQELYRLRFEYLRWKPTLFAQFQHGAGETPGTLLDATSDLGVADQHTYSLRGAIQIRQGFKIRGSYTRLRYDGDVSAATRFTFGETTFQRSYRVFTSMRGALYSGDLELDLAKGVWGYFGVMLGAQLLDVDTVIVAPEERLQETKTLTKPIPVAGVTLRLYIRRLSLEGEISGIPAGGKGHALEAQAAARLHLSDRLAGTVGYRYVEIKGETAPELLDTHLGGLTFGVELSL